MRNLQDTYNRVSRYLTEDIWQAESGALSGIHTFFLHFLRPASLTVRKFFSDNCSLRASALTFYSLLAVVPIIALIFGLAKGFGLEQRLERQLYERLAGQEAVLEKIITFARSLLEKTKGGVVAGIGVLILLWSAIKLLTHIERALNEIWRVSPRSYLRRFTDYLAIMVVGPLLVIVSSSTTVYITTHIVAITDESAILRFAGPLIFSFLKLLPFCLIWVLFIMLYMVMPNTQVRLSSSIIAGIIAGTAFQLFQGLYISAQVLMSKYNAIYGSFAALPLFLIYLQVSWIIVLFGAQISYVHQNANRYQLEVKNRRLSLIGQKTNGLAILKHLITGFQNGAPPSSAKQIAGACHLPVSLVQQSLDKLKLCMLVSEVSDSRQTDPTFQPARDIHTITLSAFLSAWEQMGQPPPTSAHDPELARIETALTAIDDEIERSPANRLIKDL